MARWPSCVAVAAALFAAACAQGGADPSGPGVAIAAAPLELPGVTDATYTLTVENHGGDVVMIRTLTSTAYGAGDGSISYVAPCDADDNDNVVKLTLTELRGPGAAVIDAGTWRNPGELRRDFTCVEGQDVAVTFDLTIARDASQGFFDVAVSFDDIFCSAELDCVASTSPTSWVCDSDSQYIEGWLDCSGGEICGGGYYYGQEVWRQASYSPVCTAYISAGTPALYGFAVR